MPVVPHRSYSTAMLYPIQKGKISKNQLENDQIILESFE
jgi:hypothetical protein